MKNKILETAKIGQVVDNKDPDNYQRVRVSIPNVTEGVPQEELPWYPILISSENNNKTSIPVTGSWVYVEFPNGDIYNGIVKGALGASPIS